VVAEPGMDRPHALPRVEVAVKRRPYTLSEPEWNAHVGLWTSRLIQHPGVLAQLPMRHPATKPNRRKRGWR